MSATQIFLDAEDPTKEQIIAAYIERDGYMSSTDQQAKILKNMKSLCYNDERIQNLIKNTTIDRIRSNTTDYLETGVGGEIGISQVKDEVENSPLILDCIVRKNELEGIANLAEFYQALTIGELNVLGW